MLPGGQTQPQRDGAALDGGREGGGREGGRGEGGRGRGGGGIKHTTGVVLIYMYKIHGVMQANVYIHMYLVYSKIELILCPLFTPKWKVLQS